MRENHYATIVSLFENFSGFQSYKISITPLYILICLGDGIHQIRFKITKLSRLLNQSIFWLILSDNKLTVSPIYACIQMEVGFVSLLYTNICTTFAIFSKEEELLSLSSTPMKRDEHLSLTLWN